MKALKILLVDDNNHFRNSALRFINSNLRFEILMWASSGEEAIKKIDTSEVDLIIMDISMQGINGLEAARRIREINKEVKIILLTISDNLEYKDRALNVGADDFISKFEFTDLLIPTVNKIFEGRLN